MHFRVDPASQAEATRLLGAMHDTPDLWPFVEKAFQDECRQPGGSPNALPEDLCTYYVVLLEGQPEMLAGVNPHNNLSSFMKLQGRRRGRVPGRDCLSVLIEHVLVPRCRAAGLPSFSTVTVTPEAAEALHYLARPGRLPKGVREIRSEPLFDPDHRKFLVILEDVGADAPVSQGRPLTSPTPL